MFDAGVNNNQCIRDVYNSQYIDGGVSNSECIDGGVSNSQYIGIK